jgi:hypothetical protein
MASAMFFSRCQRAFRSRRFASEQYELSERGRPIDRELARIDKTVGTILDLVEDRAMSGWGARSST